MGTSVATRDPRTNAPRSAVPASDTRATSRPASAGTRRTPRNHALDLVRVVAFCGVVSLHTVTPDGPFSTALNVLSRFAVPFFFAVAGFFSLGAPYAKIMRRLRHVGALCLAGTVLYLVTALVGLTPSWPDLAQLGGGWRVLIKNFVLWNDFPAAYPLWFLFALLYVYAVYALMLRFRASIAYLVGGGVALLAARVLLVEVGGVFAPLSMPIRSWLLAGIPYFSLGLLLRRHAGALRRWPLARQAALLGAGCIMSALECAVFGLQEGYAGTVAIVIGCFAICLAHPLASWRSTPLVRLLHGGDVCLIAYLVHYAVLSVLDRLGQLPGLGALGTVDALRLILVIAVSLTLGALVSRRRLPRGTHRVPAPQRTHR